MNIPDDVREAIGRYSIAQLMKMTKSKDKKTREFAVNAMRLKTAIMLEEK